MDLPAFAQAKAQVALAEVEAGERGVADRHGDGLDRLAKTVVGADGEIGAADMARLRGEDHRGAIA